jgi:hypothetical protein
MNEMFPWNIQGSSSQSSVRRFLAVAEHHLARAGGGPAELTVLMWLRKLATLNAAELDQLRWPPTSGAVNQPVATRALERRAGRRWRRRASGEA